MANSFATPSLISSFILAYLHTNCLFAKLANRQLDDSWGSTGLSVWKPGTTVKFKYPVKFTTSTGPQLAIQDINQQTYPFVVSTQRHVDFDYLMIDETLTLSQIEKQFFEPAAKTLAAAVDADCLNQVYSQIYNTVGDTGWATTGALPAHFDVAEAAREKLDEALAPDDENWHAILNPASQRSMSSALIGLYNPQVQISNIFEEGMIAKKTAGFNWWKSQNIPAQTYGTRATTGATINGTPVDGATTLTLASAGNASTYNVGDVFTVASCYKVNGESRVSYGSAAPQFFVVAPQTSTSAGSGTYVVATGVYTSAAGGALTMTVSPTIYQSTSSPLMNMTGLVTSSAVTFYGNPSLTQPQNLAFHKNAFAFVSVPMAEPSTAKSKRMTYDGISIRSLLTYDPINDREICRVDTVYGAGVPYPDQACRISC